jgi:anti-anti-sigma factor
MELSTSTIGDVVVVSLKGRIDANTALEVEQKLNSLILEGHCSLIADMREASYVASAGLKALLVARKETKRKNGELKLAELQPQVTEILDITGFTRLFKIYSCVEEAIGSFK